MLLGQFKFGIFSMPDKKYERQQKELKDVTAELDARRAENRRTASHTAAQEDKAEEQAKSRASFESRVATSTAYFSNNHEMGHSPE
jgi:cell pole-organizing protein PopZ